MSLRLNNTNNQKATNLPKVPSRQPKTDKTKILVDFYSPLTVPTTTPSTTDATLTYPGTIPGYLNTAVPVGKLGRYGIIKIGAGDSFLYSDNNAYAPAAPEATGLYSGGTRAYVNPSALDSAAYPPNTDNAANTLGGYTGGLGSKAFAYLFQPAASDKNAANMGNAQVPYYSGGFLPGNKTTLNVPGITAEEFSLTSTNHLVPETDLTVHCTPTGSVNGTYTPAYSITLPTFGQLKLETPGDLSYDQYFALCEINTNGTANPWDDTITPIYFGAGTDNPAHTDPSRYDDIRTKLSNNQIAGFDPTNKIYGIYVFRRVYDENSKFVDTCSYTGLVIDQVPGVAYATTNPSLPSVLDTSNPGGAPIASQVLFNNNGNLTTNLPAPTAVVHNNAPLQIKIKNISNTGASPSLKIYTLAGVEIPLTPSGPDKIASLTPAQAMALNGLLIVNKDCTCTLDVTYRLSDQSATPVDTATLNLIDLGPVAIPITSNPLVLPTLPSLNTDFNDIVISTISSAIISDNASTQLIGADSSSGLPTAVGGLGFSFLNTYDASPANDILRFTYKNIIPSGLTTLTAGQVNTIQSSTDNSNYLIDFTAGVNNLQQTCTAFNKRYLYFKNSGGNYTNQIPDTAQYIKETTFAGKRISSIILPLTTDILNNATNPTFLIGYTSGGQFQVIKSYATYAALTTGLLQGDIDVTTYTQNIEIRALDTITTGIFTNKILSSAILLPRFDRTSGVTTVIAQQATSVGNGSDYRMSKILINSNTNALHNNPLVTTHYTVSKVYILTKYNRMPIIAKGTYNNQYTVKPAQIISAEVQAIKKQYPGYTLWEVNDIPPNTTELYVLPEDAGDAKLITVLNTTSDTTPLVKVTDISGSIHHSKIVDGLFTAMDGEDLYSKTITLYATDKKLPLETKLNTLIKIPVNNNLNPLSKLQQNTILYLTLNNNKQLSILLNTLPIKETTTVGDLLDYVNTQEHSISLEALYKNLTLIQTGGDIPKKYLDTLSKLQPLFIETMLVANKDKSAYFLKPQLNSVKAIHTALLHLRVRYGGTGYIADVLNSWEHFFVKLLETKGPILYNIADPEILPTEITRISAYTGSAPIALDNVKADPVTKTLGLDISGGWTTPQYNISINEIDRLKLLLGFRTEDTVMPLDLVGTITTKNTAEYPLYTTQNTNLVLGITANGLFNFYNMYFKNNGIIYKDQFSIITDALEQSRADEIWAALIAHGCIDESGKVLQTLSPTIDLGIPLTGTEKTTIVSILNQTSNDTATTNFVDSSSGRFFSYLGVGGSIYAGLVIQGQPKFTADLRSGVKVLWDSFLNESFNEYTPLRASVGLQVDWFSAGLTGWFTILTSSKTDFATAARPTLGLSLPLQATIPLVDFTPDIHLQLPILVTPTLQSQSVGFNGLDQSTQVTIPIQAGLSILGKTWQAALNSQASVTPYSSFNNETQATQYSIQGFSLQLQWTPDPALNVHGLFTVNPWSMPAVYTFGLGLDYTP